MRTGFPEHLGIGENALPIRLRRNDSCEFGGGKRFFCRCQKGLSIYQSADENPGFSREIESHSIDRLSRAETAQNGRLCKVSIRVPSDSTSGPAWKGEAYEQNYKCTEYRLAKIQKKPIWKGRTQALSRSK